MFLIVGLGNPGPQYAQTRHNIGFTIADLLAHNHRVHFVAGKGEYVFCRYSIKGNHVCLLKPLTYMNRSGEAVEQAVDQWQITASQLLVVFDDFNLPFGTLRLRANGSDGGHNGMASIIYHLQSEQFARARIGIRNEDFQQDAADFVLSDFNAQEQKDLPMIIEKSAEAVESFVLHGLTKTMNLFNKNFLNEQRSRPQTDK
jgi:PTH1 family peptidyl-tRNA hydrolase